MNAIETALWPAAALLLLRALRSGRVLDWAWLGLLLGLGATPNPPGASLSPLHTAVAVASAAMIECLLMAGANASAVDAFGSTPLDWACELWGPDSHMLRLLAAAG